MVASGTRRRRPPEERTEELLQAAEAMLLERGLSSTTVADVAEAAGVAKGTIYLYFESKDALLTALRARYLARFVHAVDATMTSGRATPVTRLDRFVDGLFHFSGANQPLHHVLFHEAGFSESDAFGEVRLVLEQLVADGVAKGVFAVRHAGAAASYVLHGLHGLLVDTMHGPTGHAPADARTTSAARDLARRSLGVHASPSRA
jgi:AcrR family transcriptional regulator